MNVNNYISEENEELTRIKEKKVRELMKQQEKKQEMSTKPIPVTDSNFNEIVNKNSLALIDCWAPWCGPCVVISPIVEELAKEYAGKVFFLESSMLTRILELRGVSKSSASQHY